MNIILGSASKWRQKILTDAGYKFHVMRANIDEKAIRDINPARMALKIAHAKADALLPKITEPAILITVDQIVVCNGEVFEKPQNEKDVWRFVQGYREHSAKTITAVVAVNTKTGKRIETIDVVNIDFNYIPDEEVKRLIADGEIFGCAGGFQIEGIDGKVNPYIKSFDGDLDSVKGLPMRVLEKQLLVVGCQLSD